MTMKHAVLFAFMLFAVGCGEVSVGNEQLPTDQDSAAPKICVPGLQAQCPCLGGDKGVQVCLSDGSRYEACQCPTTPPDGGSDVCVPIVVLTEEMLDSHSAQPGEQDHIFLGFSAQVEAQGPSCTPDIVLNSLVLQIRSLDGDFALANDIFSDAKVIAEDLSTAAGPDTALEYIALSATEARFGDPILVPGYAKARSLRFMMDVAATEKLPGIMFGHRYQVSIASAYSFGQKIQVKIEHFPGDNSVKITEPNNSAAYCDPLDWDPQKAYKGCCGTFTKVNPSDLKAGDLIKASGVHSVYYYGSDNKRYLFPTSIELDSWYAPIDYTYLPAHDYNQICLSVLEITEQQLANITLNAQQVTKRPGAHVTGITSDPKRYVVDTHRVLRWASPQILEEIYGGPVDARTFLTPDAFFSNYLMGASLSSASEYFFINKYTQADIEVELGIKP